MIRELLESRRLKILWMPEQAVLGLFDRVKPYDWIRRPYFALPSGTTVVKSMPSPERMAFGFLLHNPEWEAVPYNEIPPEMYYIEMALQQPKICDFCQKEVPIGQFCTCKAPTGYSSEDTPNIVDSKGCKKLCPRCQTEMDFSVYDCPKCHYDFS